ncbi:glycosyltransferase family 39 protein, partial [candidate division FCPU426 bacterium]|nr:glycosyltransferase family 39 protein [candidate division FCPU426 bacterium]
MQKKIWEALRRRPTIVLYAAMGVCFLLGQVYLIGKQDFPTGVGITALGLLLLFLSFIGDARLLAWLQAIQPTLIGMAKKLETMASDARETKADKRVAGTTAIYQEEKTKEPAAAPGAWRWSLWEMLPDREIEWTVSRNQLILMGGVLVAVSQPLLVLEKFVPALLLLLPGIGLLVQSLLVKSVLLKLGRVHTLVKSAVLGAAGLGLVVIGHYYIWNYLEGNLTKEITGFICNTVGMLLLYYLIPRVIPETAPEHIPPLDRVSGEARGTLGVAVKAGLVAAALLLFYLAGRSAGLQHKTFLALTAIGLLVFSFPWSRKLEKPAEPVLLLALGMKALRLAAFGLALYWAYHGQMLIHQESLYPGLHRFALAGLALLIALREPRPGPDADPLAEKPFPWYWETLGLAVVLGVGFWLRFHLLDIMPYGVECDEAGAANEALEVLEGKFQSIFVHPCGRQLFMLLPKIVAMHFLGTDSIGVRFAAVVWGVANILLLYLLGRHFYGPRVALLMAALFSASRWHIHFSRYGWSNTLMILLIIAGYYFTIKGLSSRRKSHFFWAGVAFSLCVQTETAARLIPIICFFLMAYLALTYRHFFTRYWRQLLSLALGVWIAGAGIYIFWIKKPHKLLRRVHEVSIFSDDANAPKGDVLKGFLASTKLSLTQLNWHGDYRHRHNGGMSGEPVADQWTAILFVLGFAYSLYYWKRLRYFFPLLLFFGFMSASVFSLEAPQSHRAFGAIPAIFLFIGAFLDRSRRLLKETLGRPGVWAGAAVMLVLLAPITKINFQKYIDAFPAFDTNCTAAAKLMGRQWKQAYHYVMSAYLWMGHPPFLLYARGVEGQFYYQPSEIVPVRRPQEQDVLYTFILEYPPLLPLVQWFYPNGRYYEESHPKYGLQYQAWGVKKEEIMRTRGLTVSYWKNTDWQGRPALVRHDPANLQRAFTPSNWPFAGAGSAAWEGTIFIPREGEYTFYCYAWDYLQIQIGRRVSLEAADKQETRQTIWMAGGLHTFRARARYLRPGSQILFAWSCKEDSRYYLHNSPYQKMFFKAAVPETHLFTYARPVGLLETLYANAKWEGAAIRQAVEPVPFFMWHGTPHGFAPPLSADWRGWIDIKQPGSYRFEMHHGGFGELVIDGQTVVRNGVSPVGNRQDRPTNPIPLSAGRHKIFLRWSANNGWVFKFWWTTPA